MKKQIVLLLTALALCVGLCACGSGPKTAVRLEAPKEAMTESRGAALCSYSTRGELHAVTLTRYEAVDGRWEKTDWSPATFNDGDLLETGGVLSWQSGDPDKLWVPGGGFQLPDTEIGLTVSPETQIEPLQGRFDAAFGAETPLCVRSIDVSGRAVVRCAAGADIPEPDADAAFAELICVTFHDAVPAFARQPDSMTLAVAGPDEFESQALQDNGIYPDNAAFFRVAVDNSIRSAVLRRYVMQNGGWQLDDSQIFPVSGSCTVAVGGVDNNREFLTWCASGSGVHLKTWANADASLMAQRAGPAGITAGTELALVCRTSEDMHLTEDTFSSLDNIKAALSQSTDNEIVTIEFSPLGAQ